MTVEKNAKDTQAQVIELAKDAIGKEDEETTSLAERAAELIIGTAEELAASAALLGNVKGRQKALADLRLSITRPMDAAKKQVLELFKPAIDRLAEAEATIKAAALAYNQKLQRAAAAAQAELDAKAEEERQQLATRAEMQRDIGDEAGAQELEERAETTTAPAVAQPEAMGSGLSTRTVWHAEVTDLRALAKACGEGTLGLDFVLANMPLLNATARELKETLQIPGVRAVPEEHVVTRQ